MDIYAIFNKLRYHQENEVVEFKKAENNFDFDDLGVSGMEIKALKDHKVLSRKQINELLWNKLPIDYTDEQKISKIGNLLTKLRKKGIIYTDEKRLWHLSEN